MFYLKVSFLTCLFLVSPLAYSLDVFKLDLTLNNKVAPSIKFLDGYPSVDNIYMKALSFRFVEIRSKPEIRNVFGQTVVRFHFERPLQLTIEEDGQTSTLVKMYLDVRLSQESIKVLEQLMALSQDSIYVPSSEGDFTVAEVLLAVDSNKTLEPFAQEMKRLPRVLAYDGSLPLGDISIVDFIKGRPLAVEIKQLKFNKVIDMSAYGYTGQMSIDAKAELLPAEVVFQFPTFSIYDEGISPFLKARQAIVTLRTRSLTANIPRIGYAEDQNGRRVAILIDPPTNVVPLRPSYCGHVILSK